MLRRTVDDDLGGGREREREREGDSIGFLNEGSRDLSSFRGKKRQLAKLLEGEGYGRGFEKFIVSNEGCVYMYVYFGFDSSILG